jgi:hypothetical protein
LRDPAAAASRRSGAACPANTPAWSAENIHKFINHILVHELDRETNTRKIGIFYSFAGKADSGGKLASTSGRLTLMSRVLPSDNTKCWGKTARHLLWLRYLTPAKFVSGLFPDVPLF